MVSPISSSSDRECPAIGSAISSLRCGSERITQIRCPLTCPYNPFNPDSLKAFDQIVGRGLSGAGRWLEKVVGPKEWGRRFDAMDRRFMPERDLPLISYETQWQLLTLAARGQAFPEVGQALESDEAIDGVNNDGRIVLNKLAQSRALFVEVIDANPNLPFYQVWDVFDPSKQYLYVDFGDQEPLQKGALMFGRFLCHEDCLYVIPGVFVGTNDVKGQIMEEMCEYMGVEPDDASDALNEYLPEIWNICAAIQDERDGVDPVAAEGEAAPEESLRFQFRMTRSKSEVVAALREHELFEEQDAPEFGVDPLSDSVFRVLVEPYPALNYDDEETEEYEEPLPPEEPIRVGTVVVGPDLLTVAAFNTVEMELLKALVVQLSGCELPD